MYVLKIIKDTILIFKDYLKEWYYLKKYDLNA